MRVEQPVFVRLICAAALFAGGTATANAASYFCKAWMDGPPPSATATNWFGGQDADSVEEAERAFHARLSSHPLSAGGIHNISCKPF